MKTGCVILNYNDADHVLALTNEIRDYSAIDEIILVDNCSTDCSMEVLKTLESERIHVCCTDRNGGYGYGNNFGVKYAVQVCGCDYVLIVNPDVSFENDLVERLKDTLLSDPQIGVAAAIQRDRNGREILHSAWSIPTVWQYIFSVETLCRRWAETFYVSLDRLHSADVVEADCVAASLLMVSAGAFMQCGGYDEEIFLYCEETTLGCKMKSHGFRTVVCSTVSYLHLHGVTIQKSVSSAVKRKQLLLKSHRLVLKRYLRANGLQCMLDRLVGAVAILETTLRTILRRNG